MLTATAGLALGALAPMTAAEAGTLTAVGTKPIPRTLAVRRTARKGGLRVPSTSFRLTHLSVTWQGPRAQVRVRTASGWTRWRLLDGCAGGRDGVAPTGSNVMLVLPGATGYEVLVAGAGAVAVTELNTVDGAVMAQAAAPAATMPLPDGSTCAVPYLSRAAWGADESIRFRSGLEFWPPEYFPVQTLVVHHTGVDGAAADPAATVRAIYYDQALHRDGVGWGDIGYHLLIDGAGRVYEGRWSGSDGVPVFGPDPGPDGRPQMVVGAHIRTFNVGNVGVCLLGDFTSRQPTDAALRSLITVLRGLARVNDLNVLGITNYSNPVAGTAKTIRTLSGHRDWVATACPGNAFYPLLATVRQYVGVTVPTSGGVQRPPGQRKPVPTPPTQL